ncbi:hypothetical protein MNEG_16056 [Monoraphidium neglectum]|uniref:Uncharacterized protein n=1 Tax=Monoraphidium neglectum TaxID=145388 RepID=A0A0D2IVC0_9CHLO|nr:hypothetical protein MNEG_16056 [Monoraphidium neglectum]KIY91907.1 hypothetical protein MNEG_16056 [Monoraphidium neglectum]|eukprot:XP_013890927.1 hypothetical protein MNEG_16056 [Monoraphidium neglectum]
MQPSASFVGAKLPSSGNKWPGSLAARGSRSRGLRVTASVGPQHGQSIRSHVYAPARETAAAAPASDNGVRAAAHVQPPVQEAPQPNQQAPQPLPPPPPPQQQQQQQQQQQVAPPSLDLGDAAGYWDLLMHPDTEATIARAKSASDASLLRRKGHLKEQDHLIEYMRRMHETHTCIEVMLKMERWITVSGV